VSGGYRDFHSHLVPGVDDGSRSVDDALHSIARMTEAGVGGIITTPHLSASRISEPGFGQLIGFLDRGWRRVRRAAANAFPRLEFRRGFEIRLGMHRPDLSDPRLHLGGTRFVLVEWLGFRPPTDSPAVLGGLSDAGHIPVIAHPERYFGIDDELNLVRAWKRAGAHLQGSYGSLVGQYGPRARGLIMRLLRAGLLDYLSSDFHGRPGYDLYLEPGAAELRRLGGAAQLNLLARVNPVRLFDDDPPLEVPPLDMLPLAEAEAAVHVQGDRCRGRTAQGYGGVDGSGT